MSDVNYKQMQGALSWGGTASSKTTYGLSGMAERSAGNPYRDGKSSFVLPGEGTLSGMSYRRRSDIFDKEEPVVTSGGDRR
jgi:hypothetical protein